MGAKLAGGLTQKCYILRGIPKSLGDKQWCLGLLFLQNKHTWIMFVHFSYLNFEPWVNYSVHFELSSSKHSIVSDPSQPFDFIGFIFLFLPFDLSACLL